jgi:hypothetical protein
MVRTHDHGGDDAGRDGGRASDHVALVIGCLGRTLAIAGLLAVLVTVSTIAIVAIGAVLAVVVTFRLLVEDL